jgi:hypothetical protein
MNPSPQRAPDDRDRESANLLIRRYVIAERRKYLEEPEALTGFGSFPVGAEERL